MTNVTLSQEHCESGVVGPDLGNYIIAGNVATWVTATGGNITAQIITTHQGANSSYIAWSNGDRFVEMGGASFVEMGGANLLPHELEDLLSGARAPSIVCAAAAALVAMAIAERS